ncbi:hypothetical protein R3P38DRAFT_2767071 [Favolaschia claudopus]|uniref:Uncharacterized protein n=1 Tax=Favolaschia claudopus TaxID=2862362 RepID=A0AAW0CY80_9AGAR
MLMVVVVVVPPPRDATVAEPEEALKPGALSAKCAVVKLDIARGYFGELDDASKVDEKEKGKEQEMKEEEPLDGDALSAERAGKLCKKRMRLGDYSTSKKEYIIQSRFARFAIVFCTSRDLIHLSLSGDNETARLSVVHAFCTNFLLEFTVEEIEGIGQVFNQDSGAKREDYFVDFMSLTEHNMRPLHPPKPLPPLGGSVGTASRLVFEDLEADLGLGEFGVEGGEIV